eukprot:856141_1
MKYTILAFVALCSAPSEAVFEPVGLQLRASQEKNLRGRPTQPHRILRSCPPTQKAWYAPWGDDTDEYKTYMSIKNLSSHGEFKRITDGIFQNNLWNPMGSL